MTNGINPNDFKPNGIKPSDHLPLYRLPVTWLNFFVESFGLKILGQVTTKLGWLYIGRIFLAGRTEVEPFDQIAGIEWNAVEFYRICFMARSLRSLRQVATLRHGHLARRSAPLRFALEFRALRALEHI